MRGKGSFTIKRKKCHMDDEVEEVKEHVVYDQPTELDSKNEGPPAKKAVAIGLQVCRKRGDNVYWNADDSEWPEDVYDVKCSRSQRVA